MSPLLGAFVLSHRNLNKPVWTIRRIYWGRGLNRGSVTSSVIQSVPCGPPVWLVGEDLRLTSRRSLVLIHIYEGQRWNEIIYPTNALIPGSVWTNPWADPKAGDGINPQNPSPEPGVRIVHPRWTAVPQEMEGMSPRGLLEKEGENKYFTGNQCIYLATYVATSHLFNW